MIPQSPLSLGRGDTYYQRYHTKDETSETDGTRGTNYFGEAVAWQIIQSVVPCHSGRIPIATYYLGFGSPQVYAHVTRLAGRRL